MVKKWKGILLVFLWMMPVAGMVMVTNLSTGIIIMGIAFIIIFTASRQWLPFFVLMGIRWWIHGDIFEACLIPVRKDRGMAEC